MYASGIYVCDVYALGCVVVCIYVQCMYTSACVCVSVGGDWRVQYSKCIAKSILSLYWLPGIVHQWLTWRLEVSDSPLIAQTTLAMVMAFLLSDGISAQ